MDNSQMHISRLRRRIQQLEALDPKSIRDGDDSRLISIEAAISQTLGDIFGSFPEDLNRYRSAADLDPDAQGRGFQALGDSINGSGYYRPGSQNFTSDVIASVTKGKERALCLLKEAISTIEERVEFGREQPSNNSSELNDKIFIVHGREDGMREEVARYVEKIGLSPIILHEQTNSGQTIIEKFESNSNVGFAIILLTPDDEGRLIKVGAPQPRARQNVILEWGYFIGRLGRDKVLALKKGEVELPSDINGLLWQIFDEHGAWKIRVAKELRQAGFIVDAERGLFS